MEKEINILYTCDNAYLSLTSISMASVIENNKDSFINFYIATESEDSVSFQRLRDFYKKNRKIKIKYLDCKRYDDILEKNQLDRWGSNSYYVYWKLFAYDNLDVDYIWYLDSDVICLKEIDIPSLDGKAIGSCLDSAHYTFNKVANIDESYYLYNTGSLFVDVKQWRNNQCTIKVIDYISNMEYKPILCDEDIIAIALQNDCEVINPKYNYLVGYDYYGVHNSFEMYSLNKKPFHSENEILEARNNVIFYHCLGGVFGRPWEDDNDSPIKEQFNKYREKSAWPEFSKKRNISLIFRIEGILEILPKFIYNKVHNLSQKIYLKRLAR